MRPDVHDAALRAAAKVAFSVAILAGCSSAGANILGAPSGTDPAKDDDTGSTDNDIIASSADAAAKAPPKPRADASASTDASTTPKPNCENVIASAFGDGGWVDPAAASPELKTCCIENLKATVASTDAGEWPRVDFNCCSITGWGSDTGDQRVQTACTPWGPPVPPTMARRERLRRGARLSSSRVELAA